MPAVESKYSQSNEMSRRAAFKRSRNSFDDEWRNRVAAFRASRENPQIDAVKEREKQLDHRRNLGTLRETSKLQGGLDKMRYANEFEKQRLDNSGRLALADRAELGQTRRFGMEQGQLREKNRMNLFSDIIKETSMLDSDTRKEYLKTYGSQFGGDVNSKSNFGIYDGKPGFIRQPKTTESGYWRDPGTGAIGTTEEVRKIQIGTDDDGKPIWKFGFGNDQIQGNRKGLAPVASSPASGENFIEKRYMNPEGSPAGSEKEKDNGSNQKRPTLRESLTYAAQQASQKASDIKEGIGKATRGPAMPVGEVSTIGGNKSSVGQKIDKNVEKRFDAQFKALLEKYRDRNPYDLFEMLLKDFKL